MSARSMMERARGWPLALKVPLLVVLLMAAVATAVSQSVLSRQAGDQEAFLQQLAGTYLDGLATALQPAVLRRDVWEAFDVIDRASRRDASRGVIATVVTLPDGTVLAASDPLRFRALDAVPAGFAAAALAADGLSVDPARGSAAARRTVREGDSIIGFVLAEIDITPLVAVRREVMLTLIAVNGSLTLALAALGYVLVRRMMRPLSVLSRHVEQLRQGRDELIPAVAIARARGEFGPLFRQFNAMAHAVAEREALAARLAAEERLALLGKLATSMAHEVNNPLGGLMNAVDTMRRHGDDPAIRRRSLDLVERGLGSIASVVRAALVAYKDVDQGKPLRREDIEDLRHLVQGRARQRGVALEWSNAAPPTYPLASSAVRQVALNLLLNAVEATPGGGTVRFLASEADGALRLRIADGGPGLPPDAAATLKAAHPDAPPPLGLPGLGLWVAARIIGRLGGASVVDCPSGGGTTIELILPSAGRPAEALDAAD